MSNPIDAAPRRRRVWPLAAMAALVGLLATFLVVKFSRAPDDEPVVHQSPPRTPVKTPDRDPADKLLAEAETALNEGRWDEAAAKAEQAKSSRGPAANALLARIEEARKGRSTPGEKSLTDDERKRRDESARQEKERQEQDVARAELDRLATESEALGTAFRWDAALAIYDEALKTHPALAKMQEYAAARRQVEKYRNDAAKAFATNAEKARAEVKAGRGGAAIKLARMAMSLYPENPAGAALLKEISTQVLDANLVPIPATIKGGVKLGDAKHADEPERVFKSPGFLMDKFEVTNEEYSLFVQQAPYPAPASHLWADGAPRPGAERFPVTNVTVKDAEAFAAWAGKRLPTEDEWEYAARWVDGRIFPWGATEPTERNPLCQSLEASLISKQGPELKPVGSWPGSQSPFGIHDLAGSVWEWTATAVDGKRILKGGSFLTRATAARASNRLIDDADLIHPDVGFRCVKDRP
jgi:formylglycine-generating enzyme required for sulfatase activity